MLDANKPHITFALDAVDNDLQVLSFTGREALNQVYQFDIELISSNPNLDLAALINQRAFLGFGPQQGGVHGVVYGIGQGDSGKRLTRYRVSLRPQLAYLAHRINQRIFQHLNVPQIIERVLNEHGIQSNAYAFELNTEYPQREYCVQYDESDLHFVQRLCEEEGISFHFQHNPDAHTLVFSDNSSGYPKLDPLIYQQGSGLSADHEVIRAFGVRLETRSTEATWRDYDFQQPRLRLHASASDPATPALEVYDYPGRFTDRTRGKHLAKRSLERLRSDYQLAEGKSDAHLVSGHFLNLSGHPRKEWNDLWLLTEISHEGKQPQVLEESVTSDVNADDGFQQGYRNQFTAIPWSVPFRPALRHRKPQVLGSQSAVVTGPAGEEIHCDAHGRVRVQFHWDREGQADDTTSCWLRVASNWAGDRYGGISIPRVGMEVLVNFLEGDPDQPLITGCLYHAEHQVPYELPAHKTRSVFKTLSSPGGGGYNELRIEDKQGAEQIYLHAQRDWDENIEHDQRIRIGHERHDTVEANSHSEVRGEEHRTIDLDRKIEVRSSDHLKVADTQHSKVGTGLFIEAGQEIHYHAGNKVVIDAGMELTATGGGSFLKLDPSGITLSGATIKMNSGGAAGSGSGLKLMMPSMPWLADTDKPGESTELAMANAQLQLAMTARQLGASRCPICEVCREGLCDAPTLSGVAPA